MRGPRAYGIGRFQRQLALDGLPASAFDYAEEIASAFASTYRLLLAHASEFLSVLRLFAHDEVRAIPRASQTYGTLYHEEAGARTLFSDRSSRESFNKLQDPVAFRPEYPEASCRRAEEKKARGHSLIHHPS